MNDWHGVGTRFAKGVDVCHHIVAQLRFFFLGVFPINVFHILLGLVTKVVSNTQIKFLGHQITLHVATNTNDPTDVEGEREREGEEREIDRSLDSEKNRRRKKRK